MGTIRKSGSDLGLWSRDPFPKVIWYVKAIPPEKEGVWAPWLRKEGVWEAPKRPRRGGGHNDVYHRTLVRTLQNPGDFQVVLMSPQLLLPPPNKEHFGGDFQA